MYKRQALAVLIMISGMICVSATSKADFSLENAKEYFTLMHGCSRTALKNYNDEDTVDAIVYLSLIHISYRTCENKNNKSDING